MRASKADPASRARAVIQGGMLVIETIANRECACRFRTWTPEDVTTAAACDGNPEGRALAVVENGEITAVLVCSRGVKGLSPLAYRLHPTSLESGKALIEEWTKVGPVGSYVTAPFWMGAALVGDSTERVKVSTDVQLVHDGRALPREMQSVGAELMWSTGCVSGDFESGMVDAMPWTRARPDKWMSASIVMEGTVAAKACACVRSAGAGYIHAVATRPVYRKHGYASALVAAITKSLLNMGLLPVYHCDERNAASVATARSVGFDLNKKVCVITQ